MVVAYINEIKRIFLNKNIMVTLFVSALIYSVYYPQPYRNEVLRSIPLALVDLDKTPSSRELTRILDASPDISVSMVLPDLPTAEQELFKRNIFGIILIPRTFERELLHGVASPISLYADSSYFLVYSRIAGAVTSITKAYNTNVQLSKLVGLGVTPSVAAPAVNPMPFVSIPLFNPQGGYAAYLLPGAFTLIMQQTLLIAVCFLTMSKTNVTTGSSTGGNINPFCDVFGKLIAYLTVSSVLIIFYFIIIPYFYEIPRIGSLYNIVLISIPFVLSVCSLAMVIGSVFRSSINAQLMAATLGLPLFFISGFSWPIEAVPTVIRWFSALIPGSTALTSITHVAEMGASIRDIRGDFLALWGLTIAYTGLAILCEYRNRGLLKNRPFL